MRYRIVVTDGVSQKQSQVPDWQFDFQQAAQQKPKDTGNNDDEESGVEDPIVNGVLIEAPTDDQPDDDQPVANVPIGIPPDPADMGQPEDGTLDGDLGESFGYETDADSALFQDEDDPDLGFDWGTLEPPTSNEIADPTDGPDDEPMAALDPMQPLNVDDPADEEPISSAMPSLQIDDGKLMWAKDRWVEIPLPMAFSARRSIALIGNTLCAAGDATHVLSAREFSTIADAPLTVRIRRVLWLDPKAQTLLLVTVTGELVMWQRAAQGQGTVRWLTIPTGEVVSNVWQQAPGVARLLVLMESGALFTWDAEQEQLAPAIAQGDNSRPRALSELGEPMIALLQGPNEALLTVVGATSRQRLPITAAMHRASASARPMLASLADYVFLGVREHGLFLFAPERSGFSVVPGCRDLTAFTVGRLHERPTAFVGVFSELEDRTDIVAIDIATLRVVRVAEIRIHTDGAGPEDDPPERARIDAMLWDPTHLRLWAAGGFGLACFAPPQKSTASPC